MTSLAKAAAETMCTMDVNICAATYTGMRPTEGNRSRRPAAILTTSSLMRRPKEATGRAL